MKALFCGEIRRVRLLPPLEIDKKLNECHFQLLLLKERTFFVREIIHMGRT